MSDLVHPAFHVLMKFALLAIILMLISLRIHAQSNSVKVHFQYGSKPKREFRESESKWFGGIHGGHVTIEMNGYLSGFIPSGDFHVIGRRKSLHSMFTYQSAESWALDTSGEQYLTIEMALGENEFRKLDSLRQAWILHPPFDYAFLGMRYAAATYELLSKTGVVKRKARLTNVLAHFYPKPLRKKLLKRTLKELQWSFEFQPGRTTRKWESDGRVWKKRRFVQFA